MEEDSNDRQNAKRISFGEGIIIRFDIFAYEFELLHK